MTEVSGTSKPGKAVTAVAAIVAIVGLLNWGYAVVRLAGGAELASSLPLIVIGLLCMGLSAILLAIGKRRG